MIAQWMPKSIFADGLLYHARGKYDRLDLGHCGRWACGETRAAMRRSPAVQLLTAINDCLSLLSIAGPDPERLVGPRRAQRQQTEYSGCSGRQSAGKSSATAAVARPCDVGRKCIGQQPLRLTYRLTSACRSCKLTHATVCRHSPTQRFNDWLLSRAVI